MNVRLTWAWPNVSVRQRPLKEAIIEGRVAADQPWTELNRVPADQSAELLLTDVAPGTWEYRGIAVDDLDQQSVPVTTTVDVPFGVPDPLVSFSGVVE